MTDYNEEFESIKRLIDSQQASMVYCPGCGTQLTEVAGSTFIRCVCRRCHKRMSVMTNNGSLIVTSVDELRTMKQA